MDICDLSKSISGAYRKGEQMRKVLMLVGLALMVCAGDCLAGYLMAGTGLVLVAVATKGEQA